MTLQSMKALTAVALLALAAPGYAQETDDAATEETQSADPSLDTGELLEQDPIAAGEPQPGQQYIREVFGDWGLRCLRVEDGPEPCQLYQLLLNEEGNPLAEVLIIPLPDSGNVVAGATVVVPLETQLTEDLILSIDGGEARRYPFDFCTAEGCVARFGMTQAQVDQFKRGAAGRLRIVPAVAPDQEVILTMSLTGFTAGINATTVDQ